jgi:hypothetical protein
MSSQIRASVQVVLKAGHAGRSCPSGRPTFATGIRGLGVLLLILLPFGPPAAAQTGASGDDPTRAGLFDMGKMWIFENAPMAYFTET